MSFIAEFTVEIPHLARASRAVPEMRFTGEDVVLEDDRARKFVFTAHGSRLEEFEAALEDDPTVAEYSVLTELDETAYYIVTYTTDPTRKGTYRVALREEIVYTNIELRDGEYYVRARVPNRSALAAFREYCDENDIPFRLERIFEENGAPPETPTLTDAQREALQLAFERGYFDTPRETTLDELGDELDISRQAVADRLRRGHRRLIEATIVGPRES